MQGWVSPRLHIRFEITPPTLVIYRPDRERFYTFVELGQLRQEAENRAQTAEDKIKKAISKLLTMGLTPEQVAQALDIPVSIVRDNEA
jgi:predicted transposase YdaD